MPESDIDLIALGDGESGVHLVSGRLVSVSWETEDAVRAAFLNLAKVGTVVPGWRDAVLLFDPDGIAAKLQQEARDWTWDVVEEDREACLAGEFTGWAEKVHKLVGALREGRIWMAAVQRSVLALRMAGLLAVHHRLLFVSENVLWDAVAQCEGEEWRRLQASAFGEHGEDITASARAALSMYLYVAEALDYALRDEQRAVVLNAARLAATVAPGSDEPE